MPTLTTNHRAIENQITQGGAFIRCPFCNAKNRDDGEYIRGRQPGDPLCCDEFTEVVFQIITQTSDGTAKYPGARQTGCLWTMIEVKNLLYVEDQIRALGHSNGDGAYSGAPTVASETNSATRNSAASTSEMPWPAYSRENGNPAAN